MFHGVCRVATLDHWTLVGWPQCLVCAPWQHPAWCDGVIPAAPGPVVRLQEAGPGARLA
jgi:hypothetical protein